MCLDLFELFGASFIIVTMLMTILWALNAYWNNAGVVDLGWALGFVLSSWAFLLLGDGFWIKRLLLTIMVSIWGLRLFWHLWQRFDHRKEDPRYTTLKEKLGHNLMQFKMYMMFLFQGLLVIILSLPFIIVSSNAESQFHGLEFTGILIWIIGVLGETLADQQLDTFKKDPTNQGKVCNTGLWAYTRHPNYFFEFIVWIGYFLFAWSTPLGSLSLIPLIIIFTLLTKVSGVPLAEEQALKAKPEAYKEYMKKTKSAFWPWPF